jgi:hypothetical protein
MRRRPRNEVTADAQPVLRVLEVRAPSTAQPTHVERRAEAVARAVCGEHLQHVCGGFLFLADDPVADLAHDREPVHDDRLPRAQQRPQSAAIELLGQEQVRVVHGS